ncbi:MAG: FAD-dependent oxidoreductase [Alphaproteobacteria bacterium]
MEKFDLAIIGAGSGGLSVAAGVAQLGLKTALFEKGEMGGDCLNTGCVPSKALLKAARVAQGFRTSGAYGVKPQEPEVDFAAVKDHVQSVIDAIAPHDSVERFEALGVRVIKDAAAFKDAHTIMAGGHQYAFRKAVIAAGSRAGLPPIEGLDADKVLTNETIFALREKPDHLIIIGGGPIGIEMAQAHRRLGCKVSVLDMGSILANDDPQLVDILRKSLIAEGVELYEHVDIQKVEHKEAVAVDFVREGVEPKKIVGTHILVAAGRDAYVDGMDLENAGVEFDEKGIYVDARLRTSQKHIYAAGDVVNGAPQFTHVAGYHAGIIIRNVAFKIPAKTDLKALPWVTYSDPELANVGMKARDAIEKYGEGNVKIVSWQFDENDRAVAERRTEGMIKVTCRKNGKILGAAIVGPHAGELIGLWALAITKGMKIGDITGMIAPYPTLGEISKRVAGAWFTPSLFSDRTRRIVGCLQKLPF